MSEPTPVDLDAIRQIYRLRQVLLPDGMPELIAEVEASRARIEELEAEVALLRNDLEAWQAITGADTPEEAAEVSAQRRMGIHELGEVVKRLGAENASLLAQLTPLLLANPADADLGAVDSIEPTLEEEILQARLAGYEAIICPQCETRRVVRSGKEFRCECGLKWDDQALSREPHGQSPQYAGDPESVEAAMGRDGP